MSYDFMENFDKNNTRFKTEISKYIDENIRKEGHIVLGETPPVLALAGADTKLPLVIENVAIDHIIDEHINTKRNKERIFKENILNMYQYLLNPVCIISGDKKGTIIVLSNELNINNDNIIIPIEISKQANSYRANFIDTEYPKKNILIYFVKEYLKHNLIAINNKKLEDLLRPIGLLLPVEHTSTSSNNIITKINELVNSYDDSIIHNLDNVKYSKINDLENRYFKFNTDNMFFKPTFRANYLELNNACKELGWGDALQYFTEGEKLSKVRDKEYLWKIEMIKYVKDREQLQNKLIELKTKEIEEKLKEIKNMNTKQIKIKELVVKAKDIKVGQKISLDGVGTDTVEKVSINEDGKVNVSFKNASMGYMFDENEPVKVFKEYLKSFNEMVKDKIRNEIEDKLMNSDWTFDPEYGASLDERVVGFYETYLEEYTLMNKIKDNKGVGYNLANDGNFASYTDELSELYNEYELDSNDLWDRYRKDVNEVLLDMYNESKFKLIDNYIEINIDWENAHDSATMNSLISQELKDLNIDYAYDHFGTLRGFGKDIIVNVHTAIGDRKQFIESFETHEKGLYKNYNKELSVDEKLNKLENEVKEMENKEKYGEFYNLVKDVENIENIYGNCVEKAENETYINDLKDRSEKLVKQEKEEKLYTECTKKENENDGKGGR